MIPGRIEGATRGLVAPADWDKAQDGACAGLVIKDEALASGGNCMISVWHPTPREVELIQQGASVVLGVVGSLHPAVALGVGQAPSVVEEAK